MATDITESQQESDKEFAARFAELVATWKEGTRHRSRIKDFIEHPAFLEIVAIGEKAVPLILARLEKDPSFLYLAMTEITGATVVPEKGKNWIEQEAIAWLAWGRENGYRWEHVV
jgi:hypothetical protein